MPDGVVRFTRLGNASEAPMAAPVLRESLPQSCLAEVRPHAIREIELGIGALPQQEVAEALLGTGADQQVHGPRPAG